MDPLTKKAIEIIINDNKPSVAHIQRRLNVGYHRSVRIFNEIKRLGVINESRSLKDKKILITDMTEIDYSLLNKNNDN